jgi:glyoxylase-like metal-dependent hydrolase (beta-lactamase superfamily II)
MIKVGDIEITRVEEMVLPEPAATFPGFDVDALAKHRNWLVPRYYDPATETFAVVIQVWIVKTPTATIVVDTGGGNDKERPASPRFHQRQAPFLEALAKAGIAREDVDFVILTHLHVDHVGWNTMLVDGKWVPTFPNATYVMPRIEVESRDPAGAGASRPPATHGPFLDSIKPVIDAGLARLVEGNETLMEGVDLIQIPGHSPGQMAVRLRSGDEEAVFIADVMHQPIQIYMPDLNSKYCEDQELARATRAKILAYAAETGAIILPGHFGPPHGGYVEKDGEGGYRFRPLAGMP